MKNKPTARYTPKENKLIEKQEQNSDGFLEPGSFRNQKIK